MVSMDRRTFWFGVVWGLVVMLVSSGAIFFAGTVYCPSPELTTWKARRADYDNRREEYQDALDRRASWLQRNREKIQQRAFEEAVAGVGPLSKVEGDAARRLAEDLSKIRLASNETEERERAAAISRLIVSDMRLSRFGELKNVGLITCGQGTLSDEIDCSYTQRISALSNPERLSLLLRGDPSGIEVGLPTVPEPPPPPEVETPVFPSYTSLVAVNLPFYWPFALWFGLAFLFSLGFVASGYVIFGGNGDRPSHHPLRSFPNFAFGWLVMTAVLPGMLVFYLFRLLFADTRPFFGRIRDAVFKKTFANEFEKFNAQLDALKERAAQYRDTGLQERIEALRNKVRERQDCAHLDQIRRQIEPIEGYLDALDEMDNEHL